ncbi:MAG: PEP-CTERM sorting domain-containing protein [Sedimentisphaerales bacterium]|jgi:hypothetical protein
MLFDSKQKALVLYCACISAGIVLSAGGVARGDIIQIEITGQVTSVDDRAGALAGKIKSGNTITGWYIYDSGTPDSNPLSTEGDYEHNVEPFGITLNIGGFLFASNPQDTDFLITVTNDYSSKDSYQLSSTNNLPLPSGVEVSQIWWQLNDYTATALDNDAIPLGAPVLTDWQRNNLSITCGSNGTTRIGATITDAWLVVPEPASALIITLGIALMASRRNRR